MSETETPGAVGAGGSHGSGPGGEGPGGPGGQGPGGQAGMNGGAAGNEAFGYGPGPAFMGYGQAPGGPAGYYGYGGMPPYPGYAPMGPGAMPGGAAHGGHGGGHGAGNPNDGIGGFFSEIANGGSGLSSLSKLIDFSDGTFLKGAAVGAIAVLLLTNDDVKHALFGGGAKTGASSDKGGAK